MTAQQCIAHKWLQRRPLQEKKKEAVIIEAPKTPEELDVTKDNLRLFVERWSEHPNSPYLFDVATHEITPCVSLTNCNGLERSPSKQSLGGCSPSPCGSINSSPDSIIETEEILYRNDNTLQPNGEERRPSFNSLHSLERRASDSSCFVHKKADVCLRVNLAEEIKKLSDRLYMLSTMNTDLVNNNVENKDNASSREVTNVTEKIPNGYSVKSTLKTSSSSNSGPEKTNSSSISKTSVTKSNGTTSNCTTFKKETKSRKQNCDKQNNVTSVNKNVTQTTESVNKSITDNCKSSSNGFSKSSSMSQVSFGKMMEQNTSPVVSNMPWSRKKFKITNASRDVPMAPTDNKKTMFGEEFNKRRGKIDEFVNPKASGENSNSNTEGRGKHFYKKTTENGDIKTNANNTKDLLLHLLDQWDESQVPPCDYHSGRHKSISMEWSEAEKIAVESMSTINTFFRKQSSISSGVRKKQEALTSNGYK